MNRIALFISMVALMVLIGFMLYNNYQACKDAEALAPHYKFGHLPWGGCWIKSVDRNWANEKRFELMYPEPGPMENEKWFVPMESEK